MSSPEYLVWRNRYLEGKCVIGEAKGVVKQHQLNRGISRLQGWPGAVTCSMNPEFPKDIQLADNLFGSSLNVISGRAKEVLEAQGVTDVEYLPVQIIDHKKKAVPTPYFILNPLSIIDCVDLEASEATWNPINPKVVGTFKRLALRPADIPRELKMYRPLYLPTKILVRADLAEALSGAGLTGLWFVNPPEMTS